MKEGFPRYYRLWFSLSLSVSLLSHEPRIYPSLQLLCTIYTRRDARSSECISCFLTAKGQREKRKKPARLLGRRLYNGCSTSTHSRKLCSSGGEKVENEISHVHARARETLRIRRDAQRRLYNMENHVGCARCAAGARAETLGVYNRGFGDVRWRGMRAAAERGRERKLSRSPAWRISELIASRRRRRRELLLLLLLLWVRERAGGRWDG